MYKQTCNLHKTYLRYYIVNVMKQDVIFLCYNTMKNRFKMVTDYNVQPLQQC